MHNVAAWLDTKEMNALLRRTISYHDYREDFYHAFLAGILVIWWIPIRSMEKAEVMWSFTIPSMPAFPWRFPVLLAAAFVLSKKRSGKEHGGTVICAYKVRFVYIYKRYQPTYNKTIASA